MFYINLIKYLVAVTNIHQLYIGVDQTNQLVYQEETVLKAQSLKSGLKHQSQGDNITKVII